MRKQDIVDNLKLMHGLRMGGEPSSAWVAKTRESLLARAVSDSSEVTSRLSGSILGNAFGALGFRGVFGTAFMYGGAMVASVMFILGSGAVGASAMYDSVPGDTLYPFKRATEQAQVALTPSADARARLQVELMGKRVQEIAKITDKPTVEQPGRIAMAVSQLRDEAKSVEQEMTAVRKDSPTDAVELAKYIDRRTDQFHASLLGSESDVGASFVPSGDGMAEAKNIVVDASVKAVAVIIESHVSGAVSIPQWEVASTVGEKIKAVSDRVDSIEEGLSTSTPASVKESANQAKVALDAAKVMVENSDLTGALVKVIEGKELVKAAETIATASNEAIIAAAIAATGTTSDVLSPIKPGTVTTGLATSSLPIMVSSTAPSGDSGTVGIQETSTP